LVITKIHPSTGLKSLIDFTFLQPHPACYSKSAAGKYRLNEPGSNELGPDELDNKPKLSFRVDIWPRLKSPLIIQLLAITVSVIIGEAKSTTVASLIVLLIVALSYLLERRSFEAVEALVKRAESKTLALRIRVKIEIITSKASPGDRVILQSGSALFSSCCLLCPGPSGKGLVL